MKKTAVDPLTLLSHSSEDTLGSYSPRVSAREWFEKVQAAYLAFTGRKGRAPNEKSQVPRR